MNQTEPYQEVFINGIIRESRDNLSILAQAVTGSGKTVCFSEITNRYITSTTKDVVILTHKKEILDKTRQTLYIWHDIISQEITAETTQIENVRVFVAMVETFNNRSKNSKFIDYMKNVGLLIVDEAHLSNFKKVFLHFPLATRIGFTATPISAIKTDPLKNYYTSIVCGPKVKELIEINRQKPTRGVVQDMTYTLSNVDRQKLLSKGQDFDPDYMGKEFSKKRQIQNTIDAIIKHAPGRKLLCFNPNVSSSKEITKEMIDAGLNARHLDGTASKDEREECFLWLNTTPNAILCNVGIATTGFDDPSIEGVVINKGTKSETLWHQMCGRSARPYQYPDGSYKEYHIILDMGDNVIGGGLGQWSDDIEWEEKFNNPKIPSKGVAPVKECPECNYLNAASVRLCKGLVKSWLFEGELEECGFEFPVKTIEEDLIPREMIMVSKGIDVKKNIEVFSNRPEYFSFFETIHQIARKAKQEINQEILEEPQVEAIWDLCYLKIKEWIKLKGKRNNGWYVTNGRWTLVNSLEREGFKLNIDTFHFKKPEYEKQD